MSNQSRSYGMVTLEAWPHSKSSHVTEFNGEDQNDVNNLPGPAAPPPRPGVPSIRPLPPPPGLALNLPRVPPNTVHILLHLAVASLYLNQGPQCQYSRPPGPPMPMIWTAATFGESATSYASINAYECSQYSCTSSTWISFPPCKFPGLIFLHLDLSFPWISVYTYSANDASTTYASWNDASAPPPEEAPPPLQRNQSQSGRSMMIQCLLQKISFWPSIRALFASLLKEKISGEIQLPANKQKLSGKPGFLKDNLSLAYYNVGAGETLTLSLRERGGRKR
ncbi:hypothetical protein M0R45_029898 [Rubus argutus]|uniref:Ubiquitin-like domain-containing protein n=1 Tax=Rubus argutus TaxID=59490 RepID=A0AAW1WA66_RUBAR